MSRKYHIKKGDMVIVTAGVDKGQKGKVLHVQPAKERALVEGINIVSKHTKPNQENPDGGIVKKEAPVHLSNLSPIDPASGEPTRIGRRRDENGKLVRYAKKSGEEIK
jgi:large subunit ribosomal protein L24